MRVDVGFCSTGTDLCVTAFSKTPAAPAPKRGESKAASSGADDDSEGSTDAGPPGPAESSEDEGTDEAVEAYVKPDDESDDGDIDPNVDACDGLDDSDDDPPVRRDLRSEAKSVQHLLRHKVGL